MSTKATKKASPSSKPKRVFKPRAAQTHEVRIIGGLWKRTKLKVADKPGLRPTPDRVRETVFNWLGQDLSGLRCLDAFAGTGALGFEAASRGARKVVLVESHPAAIQKLTATRDKLAPSNIAIQLDYEDDAANVYVPYLSNALRGRMTGSAALRGRLGD